MNLPKIEQQIYNKSNRLATFVGFFAVGIGAIAATKPSSAFSLCLMAVPLAIDVFTLKHLIKENKKSSYGLTLYKPIFQMSMKRWVKKYLKNSENLHEKKYKALFFSIWLVHKKIDAHNLFFSSSDLFKDLEKNLREENRIYRV